MATITNNFERHKQCYCKFNFFYPKFGELELNVSAHSKFPIKYKENIVSIGKKSPVRFVWCIFET